MSIKVHPGIGVARVGNSPEYFIGPEVPDAASPAEGYRDSECRIKRQAALFRIFEHLPDGTATEIVAGPTTTITWTVNLSKTLTFEVPDTTISGPGLVASVLGGELGLPPGATLGELRTDAQGRLLVCSGNIDISEHSGPDGRAEGYVRVSVVRDGVPLGPVASSWVVIYQPDFAPGLDPEAGGTAGTLLALWPDAPPTSPELPYTDQLDRGPLTFVGNWDGFPPLPLSDFQEPFRLVAAGPSSFLRHGGYTNWASDLYGINPGEYFSGCNSGWLSGVAIDASSHPTGYKGANWRLRGFLAEQPDVSLKYVDWCAEIAAPAQINFYQVPRGATRAVPVQLQLKNFPEATAVTSTVLGAPGVYIAPADTPVVPEKLTAPLTVWAFFEAAPGAALGLAMGTVELHFGPRHSVTIPFQAEIVNEERTALALVLDCSTSMTSSRGDGLSRLQGLKAAVNVFVDVARPGAGVAVAPFSTTSLPARAAEVLGSGDSVDEAPGGARWSVRTFVEALGVHDMTSIGAGILSGQALVDAASVADFERKALIVVTDGYQTTSPYVEEVMGSVTANTYAIGIGSAFEPALREIVGMTDGFVSIMGDPVTPGNRYTLEKYLLQMLAGITAGDILVDPEGELAPGEAHRIPFVVSETEPRIDITVVSDVAPRLVVAVEGPGGKRRTLEQVKALGQARVTQTGRVWHAELGLGFDPGGGDPKWGPGSWAVWIGLRGQDSSRDQIAVDSFLSSRATHVRAHETLKGARASYMAMTTSPTALRMDPSMRRTSDGILLEASLAYAGAPILQSSNIFVEIMTPSRVVSTVRLVEVAPGLFQAQVPSAKFGRYQAVFRARGHSPKGYPFQRERVIEEFFAPESARRPNPDCCKCTMARCHCLSCKLPDTLARLEGKFQSVFKKLEQHFRR